MGDPQGGSLARRPHRDPDGRVEVDHRRGGAAPQPRAAGGARRDPGRDRHRPGRRPAPHPPARPQPGRQLDPGRARLAAPHADRSAGRPSRPGADPDRRTRPRQRPRIVSGSMAVGVQLHRDRRRSRRSDRRSISCSSSSAGATSPRCWWRVGRPSTAHSPTPIWSTRSVFFVAPLLIGGTGLTGRRRPRGCRPRARDTASVRQRRAPWRRPGAAGRPRGGWAMFTGLVEAVGRGARVRGGRAAAPGSRSRSHWPDGDTATAGRQRRGRRRLPDRRRTDRARASPPTCRPRRCSAPCSVSSAVASRSTSSARSASATGSAGTWSRDTSTGSPESWRSEPRAASPAGGSRCRPSSAARSQSKGSVAVHGVSLTVAAVGDGWFEVALIPETLQATTLGGAARRRTAPPRDRRAGQVRRPAAGGIVAVGARARCSARGPTMRRVEPAYPDLLPITHVVRPGYLPGPKVALDPIRMGIVWEDAPRRILPRRGLGAPGSGARDRLRPGRRANGRTCSSGCSSGAARPCWCSTTPPSRRATSASTDLRRRPRITVLVPVLPFPLSDGLKLPDRVEGLPLGRGARPVPVSRRRPRGGATDSSSSRRPARASRSRAPLLLTPKDRHRILDGCEGSGLEDRLENCLFHADVSRGLHALERRAGVDHAQARGWTRSSPAWSRSGLQPGGGADRGACSGCGRADSTSRHEESLVGLAAPARGARPSTGCPTIPPPLADEDNLRVDPGLRPLGRELHPRDLERRRAGRVGLEAVVGRRHQPRIGLTSPPAMPGNTPALTRVVTTTTPPKGARHGGEGLQEGHGHRLLGQ